MLLGLLAFCSSSSLQPSLSTRNAGLCSHLPPHHLHHVSQLSITMATASGLTSVSVVMSPLWSPSILPQGPTKPLGTKHRLITDHKDI